MSSNNSNNLSFNFDQSIGLIKTIGETGFADTIGKTADSAFDAVEHVASATIGAAGQTASAAIGLVDNALQKHQEIKLQKLQNQLQQMDLAHQEIMQRRQNEHEFKMLQENNRHEEKMFEKKCEIVKEAIKAASAAYEKKIDFFAAQLNCLENVYAKESALLNEHIIFLENERKNYINDANKFVLISSDINKLEEQKSAMYSEYLKSQGNLEDAIKYLEIDRSFNNINEIKMLGR